MKYTGKTDWKAISAQAVGRHHLAHKKPCEDACGFRHISTDKICFAVADGMGSASMAEAGSRFVVNVGLNVLESYLKKYKGPGNSKETLKKCLERTQKALFGYAHKKGIERHEYATTLMFGFASGNCVAVAHVGDGLSIIQQPSGNGEINIELLTRPQFGEFVGMTNSLSQANALDVAEYKVVEGEVNAVVLTTDGLLEIGLENVMKFQSRKSFWKPILDFAASDRPLKESTTLLEQFLKSDLIQSRTMDDTTLMIIIHNRGVE